MQTRKQKEMIVFESFFYFLIETMKIVKLLHEKKMMKNSERLVWNLLNNRN